LSFAGETAQIMVVTELPPNAVSKILVNAESLYGIAMVLPFPAACSAKCSITLPKVCKDLLIWLAYFNLSLLLMPVFAIL